MFLFFWPQPVHQVITVHGHPGTTLFHYMYNHLNTLTTFKIQCEYQPSLCTHHLPSKWSPFSTRMQVKHYSFILVLYLNLINSFHFNFYFKSKFYTNLNVKIFLFKSNYFHLNDYLNRFTIFIHKFMIKCTSLQ